MSERYCFKSLDGDNYLVPTALSKVFDDMELDADEDDYEAFNDVFERYRCDSHQNWTFTDPKENA